MPLLIAILQERDKHAAAEALVQSGYQFTRMASTGGYLDEPNVTLLVALEESEVDAALDAIRGACERRRQAAAVAPAEAAGGRAPEVTVEVGGAVCFILAAQVGQPAAPANRLRDI